MTLAPPSAAGPAEPRSGLPSTGAREESGGVVLPPTVRLGPSAAGRCRRRVHLDADPTAARAARAVADDGLRLRLADGARHREEVLGIARLQLATCEGISWDPSAGRPPVVIEPSLRSDTRFGAPDLLLWVEDGYAPVIIRSHRTTDPGNGAITSKLATPLDTALDGRRKARSHPADALALAHFFRLLGDLGLACSSAVGGVIGRGGGNVADSHQEERLDDGSTILWYGLDDAGGSERSVLADYDLRFADRLAVAGAAASGLPSLAAPSRIGECRRCAWWPVCGAQLAAAGDISLIVAGHDVDVLHKAGIRTAQQLADADLGAVAALPLTGFDSSTARVRARAWLAGVPLVRRVERVQVRRADLELDVDMESFLEDGAYLWGTHLSGPGTDRLGLRSGYRSFVTWQPLPDKDEGRVFADFWTYLSGLRAIAAANGLTFAAYCYSRSAEERWLRSTPLRYPRVPRMPTSAEIAAFCASDDWVDIYQEIREQFVVPGSMKLKVLAPLAGFSWRDPDPGGENSMAWYRDAVGASAGSLAAPVGGGGWSGSGGGPVRSGGGPVDRVKAERILRYNEDDVLATLALRRWLTERADEVPSVAELDAD